MQILIWTLTLLLIALWSGLAWALHALMTLDPNWVNGMASFIVQWPWAETLNQWLPGWQELLLALASFTHNALGWLGASAGWLVGAVWVLGLLAVLLPAGIVSGIVAWSRRSSARPVAA
jgi:hypothetical protein